MARSNNYWITVIITFFANLPLGFNILFGQPQICMNPAIMTPTCAEACIICDIDGFTGRNTSGLKGVAPPGFCTGTVHNIQWIAFIAGTTNLTLEVTVTNCKNGDGLEIGIYKSNDCKTFQLVSECDGDIPEGTRRIFTNTVPLIIGQHYYFVMDGNRADMCDYTIRVLSGSTKVDPLDLSGEIEGDFSTCDNAKLLYKTTKVKGAITNTWQLNGQLIGQGDSILLPYLKVGEYQLCVTASNACDDAIPTCKTLNVYPSFITPVEVTICRGDCYYIQSKSFCDPGNYQETLQTVSGCDSVIDLQINVVQPDSIYQRFNLCDGDTLKIHNDAFFTSGTFQKIFKNHFQCDSLIQLDIQLIKCNIKTMLNAFPLKCPGDRSGQLIIQAENGTPPLRYHYYNVDSTIQGFGILFSLTQSDTLQNLQAGIYTIKIEDNFGNVRFNQILVEQPDPIQTYLSSPTIKQYNLKCYGDQTAEINSSVQGGSPPYQYRWSNGSLKDRIEQLSAGSYYLTITDNNLCTKLDSIQIIQPDSLSLDLKITDPDCSGPQSGQIRVNSISGGILPYELILDGVNALDNRQFKQLTSGKYNIDLIDANGCVIHRPIELIGLEIPEVTIDSIREINLGESTELNYYSPNQILRQFWTENKYLSCDTCLTTIASPINDQNYKITIISKDGCTAEASIRILVRKDLRIFTPNVFSPNDDSVNDYFKIFGTKSLKQIVLLEIFDRWGNRVFSQTNAEPNGPSTGWNGLMNGKPVNPGVFVWHAVAEFLDNTTEEASGEITVIR